MEEKKNLPQTVIEEDINECVKRLENVKIDIANKLKSGYLRKIHPYTLEPYNEKLLLEKEASSDSSYKN